MDRLWIFLLVTSTLVAYDETACVPDLQTEAYCKCFSPLGSGISFQGLPLVGGIYDHRRKLGYTLKDLSEFPRELDTPWLIWELLNGLPGIPEITPWIRNKVGLNSGFMDVFPRRLQPRWNPMQEMNPEWLNDFEKVYCKCLSRQGYGINLQRMMFGGIYDQSGMRGWLLRDLSEYPGVLDIQGATLKLLSGLPGVPGNVEYPGILRTLWMLWQELSGLPRVPGIFGRFQTDQNGRPLLPDISGSIQTSGQPGVPHISGEIQPNLKGGYPGSADIKEGTPGSTDTGTYQLEGNQPANGLDLKGGYPGSADIKGGTPGSKDTGTYQFGGDQPANGLDLKGGIPGSADIKGGTPGSTATWTYLPGGNQPANGLDLKGVIPGSADIKGGTPGSIATWTYQPGGDQPANGLGINGGNLGSTDMKGRIPGSTATWSFQFGGNQPGNGLDIKGGTPGLTDINGGISGSTGVQVVTKEREGKSRGLLQSLFNVGGDILSKTVGGENHGLIPSLIRAGGKVIQETGNIIHGIGDTA